MFLNSPSPPAREMAQMTSIREDRLLSVFGGLDGQTLYDDVWQYNINNNMWNNLSFSEPTGMVDAQNLTC